MRKLKYYVACSIDGFIAHIDGSFAGFLTEGEHITDLAETYPETFPAHFRDAMGINAENKHFDTVLMGRKTYEVGSKVGLTNPYPQMKQYVFSRSMKQNPDANVELVSSDAIAFVRNLKNEPDQKRQLQDSSSNDILNSGHKDIWLCGGADLATTLFNERLIDELIFKVNPFLMGSGIPFFDRTIEPTSLELKDTKTYGSGVLLLHYQLKTSPM